MATRIPPSTPRPDDQQRTRPRKRPSQARSRATVDAIVEAAARILESRGHDGFTTNAVAERAGVGIGTLYQYFPDKDSLVGALIARETSRLVEEAEAALTLPSGPAALDALMRAAVGHQLRRPALARLLDFEEARMPLDDETRHVRDRLDGILMDLLARADPPRQTEVAVAAADIAAILRGMVDAAGERGETDQPALLAKVRRAVFGYLGVAAPP